LRRNAVGGDPRGYVPLVAGRVKESEKGRQGAVRKQASVGRGKAKLFPLRGARWGKTCVFFKSIIRSIRFSQHTA